MNGNSYVDLNLGGKLNVGKTLIVNLTNNGHEEKIIMSKILIGLITHPKSVANPNLYKETIEYFVLGFQEKEWKVTSTISQENAYKGKIRLIDIWISKWTNMSLVQNWIQYLGKSYNYKNKRKTLASVLDFLKRVRAILLFIVKTVLSPQSKKTEMLKFKRNVNISLSHLNIMKQASESLFDLTMILEDDALIKSNEMLRNDLIKFAENNLANSTLPSLVSLSESLPLSKLFVSDSEGNLPVFDFSENIYLPKIMHHNTTCAVIYNQKYIKNITSLWNPLIMKLIYRGVPVDWLINALVLSQPINSLFTFHSKTNLVVQGSLQKF